MFGKNKIKSFFLTISICLLIFTNSHSENNLEGSQTIIKVLDKISSKNDTLKLTNRDEFKFKELLIKSMKCSNSKFDDNPEIKAYIQVKDLSNKNKDNVYIFNGWMFSSSPSIASFDHSVYDIWLVGCD